MTRKAIRVGSSLAVTIPQEVVKAKNIHAGDEINTTFDPVKKPKHVELMDEYEKFVAQYGETLKNLSDR